MNSFLIFLYTLFQLGIWNISCILGIFLIYYLNIDNEKQVASLINNLGIIPIKLAQWCAYFCKVHFGENVITNSFQYLQCECNVRPIKNIQEKIEPFKDKIEFVEQTPISVASIAQIFKGKLNTGEEVVIKVKHENLERDIQLWKVILSNSFLNMFFGFFGVKDMIKLDMDDFFKSLESQLDFNKEAENLQYFYKHYSKNKLIDIPKYIAHNSDILIMEYVPSDNFKQIESTLSDTEQEYFLLLARILYQDNIFIKDVIHMDLHNGNWGINRDKKTIVLYDFGWVLMDQAEFKKFFILAHLNKKKTLEYILERYKIVDEKNLLQNFIDSVDTNQKLDTLQGIHLTLSLFKDEFKLDNFMFCLLSFCVFTASISDNFEQFENYVDNELKFLKEKQEFVPLCSLIQKLKEKDVQTQIDNFLST